MTDEIKNLHPSEDGRKLFACPAQFMLSVISLNQLPAPDLPEVCLAGRSNVGKSSLLNALTNRKGLARTSNKPGRTREVNYFDIGGRLRLVDLPGYGFAKAPGEVVQNWSRLTRQYLRGRACLRRVFLLIDCRHGLKEPDRLIMDMLDGAAVPYQIVFSKIDKLKKGALQAVIAATQGAIQKRPAAHPAIFVTSSDKKQGLERLRAEIAGLALPANHV